MDVSDANDPELRSPKSFSRMDHEIHNDPFPVLYFTSDSLLVMAKYNNAHAAKKSGKKCNFVEAGKMCNFGEAPIVQ